MTNWSIARKEVLVVTALLFIASVLLLTILKAGSFESFKFTRILI